MSRTSGEYLSKRNMAAYLRCPAAEAFVWAAVFAGQGTSPALAGTSMPTRLAYKRFFIRFDVGVIGGRPWRVKVVGHASEWEPGNAMPTELHGPARPHWLEGRTDALTVAVLVLMVGVSAAIFFWFRRKGWLGG